MLVHGCQHCARKGLKTAQLVYHPPAFGNVDVSAQHAYRATRDVAHDGSPGEEPSSAAVHVQHSMLVLEYGGLAAQVSLSERRDSFGITGVHMLHPGIELIGNLMILESQYSL